MKVKICLGNADTGTYSDNNMHNKKEFDDHISDSDNDIEEYFASASYDADASDHEIFEDSVSEKEESSLSETDFSETYLSETRSCGS